MSRNLPDNVSSREFDEEPDWLADKPMGRCPWCQASVKDDFEIDGTLHDGDGPKSCNWSEFETELENRDRYAAQREADAHTEERIGREARRSGEEPPY